MIRYMRTWPQEIETRDLDRKKEALSLCSSSLKLTFGFGSAPAAAAPPTRPSPRAVHHLPLFRRRWSSLLLRPLVNFEQRERGKEGGRIGAPLPLAMIYDLAAKECHTHALCTLECALPTSRLSLSPSIHDVLLYSHRSTPCCVSPFIASLVASSHLFPKW